MVATAQPAGTQAPSYVAAGNAICSEQLAQLNRLPRPTSTEQTISYLPSALQIMRREVAKLQALTPSGSGGRALQAALTSDRRLTALLSDFLWGLRHGMVEFAQLATVQTRSIAMRAQIDARFRQAGLPRCAE